MTKTYEYKYRVTKSNILNVTDYACDVEREIYKHSLKIEWHVWVYLPKGGVCEQRI